MLAKQTFHQEVSNNEQSEDGRGVGGGGDDWLGDTNYSSIRRAVLGDMHDIFVDGVTCRAKCGVRISGPLSDTVIRDVTVPADARKYDISAPTQKVVTE